MFDQLTEATIQALVDAFYVRVRQDKALGPVFARAIPDDAWPAHLGRMYAFWSSVMLTSGRYKGEPVTVHRRVAGIEPPLFETWLGLFEATAADLFEPTPAREFAARARRIAGSLQLAVFFRPDEPELATLRGRPGTARAEA